MNHSIGKLPTGAVILDRERRRIYGDNALVHEASSIISGIIAHAGGRWRAAGGFHANFDWFRDHLDDDAELAARVLTRAGFTKRNGEWRWGHRGVWCLSNITDLDGLGDILVDVVDRHRPL